MTAQPTVSALICVRNGEAYLAEAIESVLGQTVRPAEPKLSHELWVSDLAAFAQHFGLTRFALAGWSLGARISLNHTLGHPEQVSQLIMIGGSSPLLEQSDRSGFNERLRLIYDVIKPGYAKARTPVKKTGSVKRQS